MNISVRQERIITAKNNNIKKVIYERPYTYETDCHKHRKANIAWCGHVESENIKTHVICVEYYIK